MAVKHLKDGEDFSSDHFAGSGFGFSGSAGQKKAGASPKSGKASKGPKGVVLVIGVPHHEPTDKAKASAPTIEDHADGSRTSHFQDGRRVMHRADGGMVTHHPDGRVEHCYADGGHVTHHPNGLVSHHYADGGMEHRHPDGRVVMQHPDGTVEEHDSSEFAHRKPRAVKAETGGENRAPKNPTRTPTPRNLMPGGQEPYGVEPSAEPDVAGSDQTGIPELSGGKARKRK